MEKAIGVQSDRVKIAELKMGFRRGAKKKKNFVFLDLYFLIAIVYCLFRLLARWRCRS